MVVRYDYDINERYIVNVTWRLGVARGAQP